MSTSTSPNPTEITAAVKVEGQKLRELKIETLVTMGSLKTDPHHAASVPIYQTSTFDMRHSDGKFDYTRSGNPTRQVPKEHVETEF